MGDPCVADRPPEEGVGGAARGVTALVEVEVRQVEGDALVVAVGMIVEDPLGHRPDGGEARLAVGEDMSLVTLGLPLAQALAGLGDVGPEGPAEIARERAQPGFDLEAAEERAQLVVRGVEEIAADVAQEVQMAGEHGDVVRQPGDEVLAGVLHRAAEVAHDGAGRPEALGDGA